MVVQPAEESQEATRNWRPVVSAEASPPEVKNRRGPRTLLMGAAGAGTLALAAMGYLMAHRPAWGTDAGSILARDAGESTVVRVDAGSPGEPLSARKASVLIRSTPVGDLRVNGKVVGRTPMRIRELPAGPVDVEVFGNDFSRHTTITLAPGDNGTRQITVGYGSIQFRVQPYAIVTLDGQELGPAPLTPVKVFEGEHRARFSNPGLQKTLYRQIRVRAGEERVFSISMDEE